MLTSSGNYQNVAIGTSHGTGRLSDTTKGWTAAANDQNQYWQIEIASGQLGQVIGVAVQGPADVCTQCVKTWKFQYWDGTLWNYGKYKYQKAKERAIANGAL